jgi:hypothetical protein
MPNKLLVSAACLGLLCGSEGQLTYSNGSRFSAPDTLIVISVDRKATGVRR